MKSDSRIMGRIVTSYKLMLDFYGMRLVSVESGLVARSLAPRNYASRYQNLVRECSYRMKNPAKAYMVLPKQGASHNNLRISRILKCLSEVGLERLNVGFLLHVLSEQSESNELNIPGIRNSMDRWWVNCIRNDEERTRIGGLVRKVRSGSDGYVFTRDLYKKALARSTD
jgi:hypothetical protein